jgi:hypothetical protein
MAEDIAELRRRMEAAADAMDFEEARRLRDRIALIRGGADAGDAARSDTTGLIRQQPGAMGLGTSQQRVEPPPGWTPPARPDPMTSGRSRRRRRDG